MLLADLDRHASEMGARPCLVHWEDGSYKVLNFSQFSRAAKRFAGAVRQFARAESSRVVLVFLKHNVMQLPLFAGCMKAGLIPSFLPYPSAKQDPDLYWKTHAEVICRSRPALIVTYDGLMPGMASLATSSGVPIMDIAALDGEELAGPCPDEGSVAVLQHSSGTTGLKKGVALTYGQIARQIASYAKAADLTCESVVVSWLPYYHDMGLFTAFLMPLSIGATVISLDPFEWLRQPALIFSLIEHFRGTHCWLPNFAFNHIVNTAPADGEYDLTSLRALINCSEPVRASTFEAFISRFEQSGITKSALKACYAMAETSFAVSQTPVGEGYETVWYNAEDLDRHSRAVRRQAGAAGARPYVSNGSAIEGVEIRVLPDNSGPPSEPPIGVPVGEIAVRGEFVFQGYFMNDEATQAAFQNDWYRTGDIGFIDEGRLFICGRKKDILIVHGRNYYAHDVEAAASSVTGVVPGRAVAIGVMNDAVGSEDVIILAETDEPEPAHKALQRAVKERVYGMLELTPRQVGLVPRGWLIKTTSGKMSRSENLTRFLSAKAQRDNG